MMKNKTLSQNYEVKRFFFLMTNFSSLFFLLADNGLP